jgi:5,10-methenyltetrahydrofolate synthetase
MDGLMDIKQWRKQQREQLLAARNQISREQHFEWTQIITALIIDSFPLHLWTTTGFYWPFQGEFDPRFVVKKLRDLLLTVALPDVVEKKAPLQFRQWWVGAPMSKGIYDLPVPDNTPIVIPNVVLIPPIGFDEQGYRLGYGGGYFDRTLASMAAQPLKVGVAFELSRIPTIHPQPYDIPMDFIVTPLGVHMVRDGKLEKLTDAQTILKLATQRMQEHQHSSKV